jgi:hypothetical protein
MKKFTVTIEEVLRHTLTVEADSEEEASEIAMETLLQQGEDAFNSSVEDRSVYMVL